MLTIVESQLPHIQELKALFAAYQQTITSFITTSAAGPESLEVQTAGEHILLAMDDRDIVGFVSIWLPDHFIHHLYVVPAYGNRGVAAALLRATILATGLPIRLKCLEANGAALSYYKRKGFTQVDTGFSAAEGPYQLLGIA